MTVMASLGVSSSGSWGGIGLLQRPLARWLFAFGVMFLLLYVVQYKTLGILGMLILTGVYVAGQPLKHTFSLWKATPLLIYPLLAMLSTLWSEAPAITLKISTQFLVTAAIGVVMYRTVPYRIFITALFAAAMIACIQSLFLDANYILRGSNLIGIAGSKNMMAFIASLLTLSSVAIATSKMHGRWMRLVSIGGMVIGTASVAFAHSAGAYVGTAIGAALIIGARVLVNAPPTFRLTVLASMLLLTPVGMIAQPMIKQEVETFAADVLDKDVETLTGRTYLWGRAAEYIAEKPVLGHGYGAFWREGSLEAEGLWSMFGIKTRTGFNFHNQFVEATMDEGVIGVIVFSAMLLLAGVMLGTRLIFLSNAELPFFVGMFAALAMRTPVESVVMTQFSALSVLYFMCTCAAVYGSSGVDVRATIALPGRRFLRHTRGERVLVQKRQKVVRKRKRRIVQHRQVQPVERRRVVKRRRVLRQTLSPTRPQAPPSRPDDTP